MPTLPFVVYRLVRLTDVPAHRLMGRVSRLLRAFRPLVRVLRSTHRTVAAVPELVDAILLLPRLSEQLEIVAFQTASLAEMHQELLSVRSNTAFLPHIDSHLAQMHTVVCQVELNTQAVQQLADVATPLQSAAVRFGRLADRLAQRRVDGRGRPHGG